MIRLMLVVVQVGVASISPRLAAAAEVAMGGGTERYADLTQEATMRAEVVQRLLRTPNQSYGPNCWNTALLASKLTDSVHYTSDAEFWHWMNSPFCRIVPGNEPLRYGDIGNVFASDGNHFHSFMRMNDDLIFQKAGPQVDAKWEITNYEKILFPRFFKFARSCKGTEDVQRKKACGFRVAYSRCQPIPTDFYSKHADLASVETELKQVDAVLAKWMQKRTSARLTDFNSAIAKLDRLSTKLSKMRFFGEKEFARKALLYRIAGSMMTDSNSPDLLDPSNRVALNNANNLANDDTKTVSLKNVDRTNWRAFLPSGQGFGMIGTSLSKDQNPAILSGSPERARKIEDNAKLRVPRGDG